MRIRDVASLRRTDQGPQRIDGHSAPLTWHQLWSAVRSSTPPADGDGPTAPSPSPATTLSRLTAY